MGDLGGGLPDFSLLPGVTDQEASDLSQVFASVTAECEAPTYHFAIPTEALKELYKFVCGFLRSLHAPQWIARIGGMLVVTPLLAVNYVLTVGITVFAPAVSALALEGLGVLDVFRKQADPTVALVATAVGLVVAIPAVAMYNLYQRISRSILANTDALSHVLLSYLAGVEAGYAPPVPVSLAKAEKSKAKASPTSAAEDD